jgi:predicted nuclease of predicted toxin-antitoxin system
MPSRTQSDGGAWSRSSKRRRETADTVLVIDANLSPRLADPELCKRGIVAVSLQRLGFKKFEDPEMIDAVAAHFSDARWVLVTTDDKMPLNHAGKLAEHHATVAAIDGRNGDVPQDEWRRDTVHRWAHLMRSQPPGTIRRYSPTSHGKWTNRWRSAKPKP